MVTIDEVLRESQKNNRICPLPYKWQELFDILPEKRRTNTSWEPSPPLILAAWATTPALYKVIRLKEHIEWAASHHYLDEVYSFLCGLQEDQWFHLGE